MGFGIATTLLVVSAACTVTPGQGGSVDARIASAEPFTWDPALAGDAGTASVHAQVYEGLTTFDPDSNVQPALASSWVASEDGRQLTFQLRPGIRYSDGSEITAQHVVDSWLRLIDPAQPSPLASLLDDISGAAAYRAGSGERDAVGLRAEGDTVIVEPASAGDLLPGRDGLADVGRRATVDGRPDRGESADRRFGRLRPLDSVAGGHRTERQCQLLGRPAGARPDRAGDRLRRPQRRRPVRFERDRLRRHRRRRRLVDRVRRHARPAASSAPRDSASATTASTRRPPRSTIPTFASPSPRPSTGSG